jgi:hypothetical protein
MVRQRHTERGRSDSRRRGHSQRAPTPGRQADSANRSEDARIDRLANAALKELLKLQQQTASRSGPKWPCACGYKTNFCDRTTCYRCLAKKGAGKAPPAATAAATAPALSTQVQPSPDSDLEACRRSIVDRLRNLKHLLDQSPGDSALVRWVSETEGELVVIKAKIHSLKTPAARLQACLTKKTAADREVGLLAETARVAAEALDLANGKLVSARELQAELELELRDLRLDGLLGHPPATPAALNPIDLLAFATAIMKAVAPAAVLPEGLVDQLAAMCNLVTAPPDVQMDDRDRFPEIPPRLGEQLPTAPPANLAGSGSSTPRRSRSPTLLAARAAASADLAGSAARAASTPVGGQPPVAVLDPTQLGGSATQPSTAPRGSRFPGVGPFA